MRLKNESAAPKRSTQVAILTGNRAGIVESANAAWTEITGFPLEETVSKPITHFLDHAGIEIELVDFVSQNFLEGRPCSVEFPFETFTGRTIRVHLGVESLRNELGEVAEFRATAQTVEPPELSQPHNHVQRDHSLATEPTVAPKATAATDAKNIGPPARRLRGHDEIDLSEFAYRESLRWQADRGSIVLMDWLLAEDLNRLQIDEVRLERVLAHLLDSAQRAGEDAWGCITILTGRTLRNRSHRSKAHPIAVRPAAFADDTYRFIEVHDTAAHLELDALRRIREGDPSECAREGALATATALAEQLGLLLHIDSTPGCGTQALLLFKD
jgi:hypothetical protein